MERDPRLDPRVGDVLRCYPGPRIVVEGTRLLRVRWTCCDFPGVQSVTRATWRDWAKDKQVIHRAE